MRRTVYRVVPDAGNWTVHKDAFALGSFAVKADAVTFGQLGARAHVPSRLVVQDEHGGADYESVFGEERPG